MCLQIIIIKQRLICNSLNCKTMSFKNKRRIRNCLLLNKNFNYNNVTLISLLFTLLGDRESPLSLSIRPSQRSGKF